MKKAIILLSGSPSGKNKFIEEAKKSSWLWNCNSRDFLGTKAHSLYWDGEKNEKYYDFTLEFLNLVNKYFYFEARYLKDQIEKFLSEDSESKTDKVKKFNTFLLIVHGVSKELVSELESEYGVFQVHISQRNLNTNIELYDTVLYEDDDNFENEVNRVIRILTKGD